MFALPSAVVPLVLAAAFAVHPVPRPVPRTTFVGRNNQLHVKVPRMEGAAANVVIDRQLDEPVWQGAALLTGFSQFAPQDGVPAADSTEVLLWYSSTALH